MTTTEIKELSESILNIQRSIKESDIRYHQAIIDSVDSIIQEEKNAIKELVFIRDNLLMLLGYAAEDLSAKHLTV
ncbi:MAG TPA: hypothetical protein PKD00_00235 [Burkholderiales bacterium]|nr:hypothetical protein [Burkholderiales bacterium]